MFLGRSTGSGVMRGWLWDMAVFPAVRIGTVRVRFVRMTMNGMRRIAHTPLDQLKSIQKQHGHVLTAQPAQVLFTWCFTEPQSRGDMIEQIVTSQRHVFRNCWDFWNKILVKCGKCLSLYLNFTGAKYCFPQFVLNFLIDAPEPCDNIFTENLSHGFNGHWIRTNCTNGREAYTMYIEELSQTVYWYWFTTDTYSIWLGSTALGIDAGFVYCNRYELTDCVDGAVYELDGTQWISDQDATVSCTDS